MISKSISRRYVTAIYELADEHNKHDLIFGQLRSFNSLVNESDDLNRVFSSPAIQPQKKLNIFAEIASKTEMDSLTAGFVNLLIRKGRINHLGSICEGYEDLERKRKGIIKVVVTTAKSLDEKTEQELRQKLASSTRQQIELETINDPEIVGGMIARIGGTVYDGSIDRQLALIQQRLGEE